MLVDIVNALDPQLFEVSVCVTRSDITMSDQLNPGISFTALRRNHSFDLNGFRRLRCFAQQQHVDVFHAHGRSSFAFLSTARILGFIHEPIILHDHFGDIETDQSIPYWFPFIASIYLAHYIGVCDLLGDWAVRAGVKSTKVTILENALDLKRFSTIKPEDIHNKQGIPENPKICVMVGNIRPAKGLDLLINSCLKIPREMLPVFVVVGKDADSAYTQMCLEIIRQHGLSDQFRFVGKQDNSIAWMKGADLAVMPSRSESGPLVLIEYLACNLPFVAFNVGGISQQLNTYLPDQFSEPENVDEFAGKLETLLDMDAEKLKKMSENYRSLAGKLFDIQNRIPILEDIYQKVLQTER